MYSIFNCFRAIINAWYGRSETPGDNEESTTNSTLSVSKSETIDLEPLMEDESENNIIITEMLASLSILEEAEASVFERHTMLQMPHMIAQLSGIIEMDSQEEKEANEPLETSIPERKPRPIRKAHLPDIENKRANVITEIINTERDYVKNLRDINEGYYKQCYKAKDLFPHARMVTLFSNIVDIYKMHKKLLSCMEKNYNLEHPHMSEFGACFMEQMPSFMMYAEYCKHHLDALEEWSKLIMVEKYTYFFEVCRMRQQMINLQLDGFLIMPVQKICKYPLLLKELLTTTLPSHPDIKNVEASVVAIRKVLDAINTEKAKDEEEDKLLSFQRTVSNWLGEDLTFRSSQMVHRGDLVVIVLRRGRAKNFVTFLFDNQMILCKKDLIRRHILYYKERIYIETGMVEDVLDGVDEEFDSRVKYAFKLRSKLFEDQCRLFFAKNLADKQLWLRSFHEERNIAEGDKFEESFYDFPALNQSTVTQEQLSFLSQPARRKSTKLRNFRGRIFS
ncbi:rho guanine nucleotide exchange factor 9-like isoform X1 [Leucoraja erinacea]|uniref:rho guanine nucleotide exchange factor 9-like isoform X1 n=2 Tax=Leucoraja erinaceus TaxID=7782 RepID=UPI0024585629|nr:rho guanine nucleotide exchange factor 9-like isoform X1 [Leucoraja erinacea]